MSGGLLHRLRTLRGVTVRRHLKELVGAPLRDAELSDLLEARLRGGLPGVGISEAGPLRRVTLPGAGRHLLARPYPHSDLFSLEQVFVQQAYRPAVDYLRVNHPSLQRPRIIDAGANVGYATAYFLDALPGADVICVEPEDGNLSMLSQNLSVEIGRGAVHVHRGALLGEAGRWVETHSGFRDGRDWSVSVTESEVPTSLESTTVGLLMEERGWDGVDLVKLDLEGSERFVLHRSADLSFLQRTRALVVEIHDEFECREEIRRVLCAHDFTVLELGENTMAIHRRLG